MARTALAACLLGSLSACGNAGLDGTASPDDRGVDATTAGSEPEPSAATPLLADPLSSAPAASGSLTLSARGDALDLTWRFDPRLASVDSRLLLELVGAERRAGAAEGAIDGAIEPGTDTVIDELRPALRGTPTRGGATLSVQAHQLAWRSTFLRARLVSAAGQTLAITAPQSLAPMLAAVAEGVEASDAGARFGRALAFSTGGSVLVIADPDNEALLLRTAGEPEQRRGGERVPVAGLARALPGSVALRAATHAAVLVAAWQSADAVAHLVILESAANGFREARRDQHADTHWQDITLAANGRQLDLLDTQGRHRRLLYRDSAWREDDAVLSSPRPTPGGTVALDPRGEPVLLSFGPGGRGVLEIAGVKRTLPDRWPSPAPGGGAALTGTNPLAARLSIDGEARHLAIATLEHPSGGPRVSAPDARERVTPTLRLFARGKGDDPWHLQRRLQGPATWSDAHMTLGFGTRPAARTDTLMWHWARPHDGAGQVSGDTPPDEARGDTYSSPGLRGETAGHGLIVLSTRAMAQAFGDADRTDRLSGGWRVAFSLPADAVGTGLAGRALPSAAAMPAQGNALAFTGSGEPSDTSAVGLDEGARTGPVVRLD